MYEDDVISTRCCLTNGDNDEWNSTNIPHSAVEFEIALPPQHLMSPLYNPAHIETSFSTCTITSQKRCYYIHTYTYTNIIEVYTL